MGDEVKVLLVEDDRDLAEMYRLKLTFDGLDVHLAEDGQAAVDIAPALAPDVILLDLQMPRKDGFEALGELKAQPETANTPVVILSNFSDPDMKQKAKSMGATEFLVKSDTSPTTLTQRIRGWIRDAMRR